MLQKTDNKRHIFFYLIIILVLSSIHNSNFKYNNFFIVKEIEVVGLNRTDNLALESKFKDLIGSNIFLLNKNSFRLIDSVNLIKSYDVKKIYPNQIKVYLKPAVAISVVRHLNESFILGNNGKSIELDNFPTNIPEVTRTNDTKKIFQTIKIINKSNIDISNVQKINFFPSERIDIVFENKKKVRFPINLDIEDLNFAMKLIKDEEFKRSKILDLRVPNKVITYDW